MSTSIEGRPAPKFAIGEVCILAHPQYNELNGEYVIRDFQWYDRDNTYGYLILDHYVIGFHGNPSRYAAEFHLRKKYPPSTQSFTELLDTLKGRVVA
jgi:hypothetical protein